MNPFCAPRCGQGVEHCLHDLRRLFLVSPRQPDKLIEPGRLLEVRQHRAPPDQRAFIARPKLRARHFQRVEAGRQPPEARRIKARRDIGFQQFGNIQAARFGRFGFPGAVFPI